MSVQEELEIELEKIKKSNQFIIGVLSFADTEENMQLILDYIKSHPNCDDQDVSMLAFELYEMREIPIGTEEYKKRIREVLESG